MIKCDSRVPTSCAACNKRLANDDVKTCWKFYHTSTKDELQLDTNQQMQIKNMEVDERKKAKQMRDFIVARRASVR